jgi:hypothetical protein
VWEILLWSSCARQLEGQADGRPAVAQRRAWRRLVVLDSNSARDGAAVPGMVAWQRGWPHRVDGDGGDAPHRFDVTALSREGTRQVSVPFLRVPPSSFEGATCRPYESGRHSVTELTLALPHNGGDGLTGRVAETASGYDSQEVSRGMARIRL